MTADAVFTAIQTAAKPLLSLAYIASVHMLRQRTKAWLGQKKLYDANQLGQNVNGRGYYTQAQLTAFDFALTVIELSLFWFLAS